MRSWLPSWSNNSKSTTSQSVSQEEVFTCRNLFGVNTKRKGKTNPDNNPIIEFKNRLYTRCVTHSHTFNFKDFINSNDTIAFTPLSDTKVDIIAEELYKLFKNDITEVDGYKYWQWLATRDPKIYAKYFFNDIKGVEYFLEAIQGYYEYYRSGVSGHNRIPGEDVHARYDRCLEMLSLLPKNIMNEKWKSLTRQVKNITFEIWLKGANWTDNNICYGVNHRQCAVNEVKKILDKSFAVLQFFGKWDQYSHSEIDQFLHENDMIPTQYRNAFVSIEDHNKWKQDYQHYIDCEGRCSGVTYPTYPVYQQSATGQGKSQPKYVPTSLYHVHNNHKYRVYTNKKRHFIYTMAESRDGTKHRMYKQVKLSKK